MLMRPLLFTHDGNLSELLFERMPEVDLESSQWTDALMTDATTLIYQNLQKLDSFVSSQLLNCKRPNHFTIYWLPYTLGALGLCACSIWLVRQSSLVGSSHENYWLQGAKKDFSRFFAMHVKEPIICIQNGFMDAFWPRNELDVKQEEFKFGMETLYRMMRMFFEEIGEEVPESVTDEMLVELFREIYAAQMRHPIRSMIHLPRALHVKVQMDIMDAKGFLLGLHLILRKHDIELALLAALPAISLFSLLLLLLVKAAKRKSRIARRQQRMLISEIWRRLMEVQACNDNGKVEEACCQFGLAVYTLDKLYRTVEPHARKRVKCVREDILQLTMPNVDLDTKMWALERLLCLD